MQQTEQYGFNLIGTDDPFSPEPLNENARKMEATMSGNARKAEEALSESTRVMTQALNENVRKITEELAAKGTCTVAEGSYVGTERHPRDIEVGFAPKFLLIYSSDGLGFKGRLFGSRIDPNDGSFYYNNVELTETGFRLTTVHHNRANKTAYYIAFS